MNYAKLVNKLRSRIFNYYDESESKGEKASRILGKAIKKKVQQYAPMPIDEWGATWKDRNDLGKHGICWMD